MFTLLIIRCKQNQPPFSFTPAGHFSFYTLLIEKLSLFVVLLFYSYNIIFFALNLIFVK